MTILRERIKIKIDAKKFFRLETTRVVAYKTLYRFLIGLVFIMAWNLFVNTKNYYSIFEIGFFTMGICFIGLCWKNYMQIDGLKVHGFEKIGEVFKKKNNKPKVNKSMVDFVDEDTPQFDNLDDADELRACFFSNLFAGLIYISVSIIYICFFR